MPTEFPRIIVNLKTYAETSGSRALELAKAAARIATTTGVGIALAPQALDLRSLLGQGVPVYAQHFDPVEGEQATGWTSLDRLIEAGAAGSLINHSEHRLDAKAIAWCVQAARRTRIVSVVCAKDAEESGELARLTPDLIAVEPPELIGGAVSVTTADPDVVAGAVDAVTSRAPGIKVLCGAGIKNRKDVEAAVELGAYGILLASGVTKASRPAAVLEDLAQGFR